MRVLISGAGIAGPTLAWFLAKAGARVTVVEKSQSLLSHGQNVDINDSAITVIKKMGLIDEVRRLNTTEKGTQFVDSNGHPFARFPVKAGSTASPTSEFEILRGDLAAVLYDASKDHPNVSYLFGTTVKEVVSNDDKAVKVQLSNGEVQEYDLLVAADGQWSRVRKQCFPPECVGVVDKGLYVSYWTAPRLPSDNDWWNLYLALESRVISLRPDPHGTIRASFSLMPCNDAQKQAWQEASKGGKAMQEKLLRKEFADVGWQVPRLLDTVAQAPDYYFQAVQQIRMSTWSSSRVVCLGDAAHAPTPLTGMGTSLAIIGAYILAVRQAKHLINESLDAGCVAGDVLKKRSEPLRSVEEAVSKPSSISVTFEVTGCSDLFRALARLYRPSAATSARPGVRGTSPSLFETHPDVTQQSEGKLDTSFPVSAMPETSSAEILPDFNLPTHAKEPGRTFCEQLKEESQALSSRDNSTMPHTERYFKQSHSALQNVRASPKAVQLEGERASAPQALLKGSQDANQLKAQSTAWESALAAESRHMTVASGGLIADAPTTTAVNSPLPSATTAGAPQGGLPATASTPQATARTPPEPAIPLTSKSMTDSAATAGAAVSTLAATASMPVPTAGQKQALTTLDSEGLGSGALAEEDAAEGVQGEEEDDSQHRVARLQRGMFMHPNLTLAAALDIGAAAYAESMQDCSFSIQEVIDSMLEHDKSFQALLEEASTDFEIDIWELRFAVVDAYRYCKEYEEIMISKGKVKPSCCTPIGEFLSGMRSTVAAATPFPTGTCVSAVHGPT
ncbi:hypothetical protein WJX82_000049 [Trebouxia sp. C0006]